MEFIFADDMSQVIEAALEPAGAPHENTQVPVSHTPRDEVHPA